MQPEVDPAELSTRIDEEIRRAPQRADGAQLEVDLIRADEVKVEPVRWRWNGYLAAGKLHILAGSPGTGKTTIAIALAATITGGGWWPDGTRAQAGSVMFWSGEDDWSDVLVPRLAAMRADLSRVSFVGDVTQIADGKTCTLAFNPARDIEVLARRIAADPPALLIVDPIVSAVSGDSHRNAEVRRDLQPLVDLAQRYGVAVVGITHFSKGTQGRDPTERVTGSLAFGALARLVFVASRFPDDDDVERRVFMRAKSNVGSDEGGFEYHLEQREVPGYPGIYASCVSWGQSVQGSARDFLAAAEANSGDERTGTDEAEEFLRAVLANGGVAASEVLKQARQAGISEKCLRTARHRLKVKPAKRDFSSGWWWALPAEDALGAEDALESGSDGQGSFVKDQRTDANLDAQDAQTPRTRGEGIFGGGGHLGDRSQTLADDAEVL